MQIIGPLITLDPETGSLPVPWWCQYPLDLKEGAAVYAALTEASVRPVGDLLISPIDPMSWARLFHISCCLQDQPAALKSIFRTAVGRELALIHSLQFVENGTCRAELYCEPYDAIQDNKADNEQFLDEVSHQLKASGFSQIAIRRMRGTPRIIWQRATNIKNGFISNVNIRSIVRNHFNKQQSAEIDLGRVVVSADTDKSALNFLIPRSDAFNIIIEYDDEIGVMAKLSKALNDSGANTISMFVKHKLNYGLMHTLKDRNTILLIICEPDKKPRKQVIAALHEQLRMLDPSYRIDFKVNNGIDAAQCVQSESGASIPWATSKQAVSRLFISYSTKDQEFVTHLESKLTVSGFVCWRDEHKLVSGRITSQIERAIISNDVVLVILSKASISSDWVRWELDRARELEKHQGRDVICPIAIDRAWKAWNDDPVLKRQVLKYHVVSFEGWHLAQTFDHAVERLTEGLRRNYATASSANE